MKTLAKTIKSILFGKKREKRLGKPRGSDLPGAYSVSPEDFHVVREEEHERLHAAHVTQTHGNMLRVARQCLERRNIFGVERECADLGLTMFLRCLVRRVDAGAAGNLIAQLPAVFRDTLLEEPAGPDVGVNLEVFERAIRKAVRLKSDQSRDALIAYVETLVLSVTPGVVESVSRQLPNELRELFIAQGRAA